MISLVLLPRAIELAADQAAKDRRTLTAHKRLLFGAAAQMINRS